MNVVGREHVVCHVALIDVYVRPLPALCLMAGYGVGILYLQGIVTWVLPYLFRRSAFRGTS